MDQQSVRKTYQYKLQPTAEQERELERTLMLCRTLYNVALERRITAWQRCHVAVSRLEQEAELKAIRAAWPEDAAIHSHLLQDVLARLATTYQAFFRRVQRGERAGCPRFKGASRSRSFTFKEYGNGARVDNRYLVLSQIGRVPVRWSRPLEGTPNTVTIIREADGWYVASSCAEVPLKALPLTGQETGIDLGLESFATLADASQLANPRIFRVAERNLRRAQRRVSRRTKGSKRRRQAVPLRARAHQRVRRARPDCQHQEAQKLVQAYDVSSHAAVPVAHRLKHHHLAQASADGGWSAFLSILTGTAAAAGQPVVAVTPAFTAPACSGGGILVHEGWSVRWHRCPACGARRHRDPNAARTILVWGREHRGAGQAPQARTWAVGPSGA